MKKLGLNTLRELFIEYFKENDHYTVKSYPLIPENDKTLLYIVAGMVPLKDYFSGVSTPKSPRMATCQKCVRTNDIDNVGYTARHCSMFEMLGNFSFGDYFKEEAIELAWNFFIKKLEIPVEKLSVSVYEEDDESYEIWKNKIGLPDDKIVRLGKEDNFWEIGSGTGPCGPCSEIFFDRGVERGCGSPDCKAGCDCDRFVEVWNLVFTQFDKQKDGSLLPLKKKNIDTGMGLERIACVMQDVESVFDVDVMQELIRKIESISGKTYGKNHDDDVSIRIITDHIRAVTFIVSEGVIPDNESRGYVLRMLFRRAVRRGKLLGINEKFMSVLADTIIDIYSSSYPELSERREYIKNIIDIEEDRFDKTLEQGIKILDSFIDEMKENNSTLLSGEKAFKLYDTYGFPLDLTKDVLRSHNYTVNDEEFKSYMDEQRNLARSSRSKSSLGWDATAIDGVSDIKTEFVGYDHIEYDSQVLSIIIGKGKAESCKSTDEDVLIVFKSSPMYCESGGQVSDTGRIITDTFEAEVVDVIKLNEEATAHKVVVKRGELFVDQFAKIEVDKRKRFDTMRNHTATHLLHKALRDTFGSSVEQAGSLVDPYKLRFDFTLNHPVSHEDLLKIEKTINQKIVEAIEVRTDIKDIESAKKAGAMALFGEKYSDVVRVVNVGDYSIELCGGTHVKNTSEIGLFRIVHETSAASGVRRIEAVTGHRAYEAFREDADVLDGLSKTLKTQRAQITDKVQSILNETKTLSSELEKLKNESLNKDLDEVVKSGKVVNDITYVTASFEAQDNKMIRSLADDICNRSGAFVAVILNDTNGKLSLVVKANKEAIALGANSGKIVKSIAVFSGGNGGGKPEMAQAGAKDKEKAKLALSEIEKHI